jgi:hypothetical protein
MGVITMGKVVFQVPRFYTPRDATWVDSPPMPANDILVRGGGCIYGRWTGKGAIPPGINWVGMEEGLRFWGTPMRTGRWEAEFEGPYPANFESDLTQGGSGVPPLRLDAGDVPEEIVVSKFTLQFEAVEQAGYTFGQVLKEIFSNLSMNQMATRPVGAWSARGRGRWLGAGKLSPSLVESNAPDQELADLDVGYSLPEVLGKLVKKIKISKSLRTGVMVAGDPWHDRPWLSITHPDSFGLQITATSTKAGAISTPQVWITPAPGEPKEKITTVFLETIAFTGGIGYSVSIGGSVFTVRTEAATKAGLWKYSEQDRPQAPLPGPQFVWLPEAPITCDDLTEDDYAASDWFFSEPYPPQRVIDRSYDGCLLTAEVRGPAELIGGVRRAVVSAATPF